MPPDPLKLCRHYGLPLTKMLATPLDVYTVWKKKLHIRTPCEEALFCCGVNCALVKQFTPTCFGHSNFSKNTQYRYIYVLDISVLRLFLGAQYRISQIGRIYMSTDVVPHLLCHIFGSFFVIKLSNEWCTALPQFYVWSVRVWLTVEGKKLCVVEYVKMDCFSI